MKNTLLKRYNSILENISNTKKTYNINSDVTLVAVTKYARMEVVNEFLSLELSSPLAESKAQNLRDRSYIVKNANWHFIGRIQKNKIKYIVGTASLIHSIDSIDILSHINEYSCSKNIKQDVLLQFNISNEVTKGGFYVKDYKRVYDASLEFSNINVLGFMGMATYTDDQEVIGKEFESLKIMHSNIKEIYKNELFNVLSMGMSSDYEIAIKEGSTMIRVGSTLFDNLI